MALALEGIWRGSNGVGGSGLWLGPSPGPGLEFSSEYRDSEGWRTGP